MPTIQIAYSVEVYAEVDTDTGAVRKLRIDDDHLAPLNKAVTMDGKPVTDQAVINTAYTMFDTNPGTFDWQFGFDS